MAWFAMLPECHLPEASSVTGVHTAATPTLVATPNLLALNPPVTAVASTHLMSVGSYEWWRPSTPTFAWTAFHLPHVF
jgi:hypothetical protein